LVRNFDFFGCVEIGFYFLFLGQITFDQDILDEMENKKLNDTNLFRTNSGRIKQSI
jgi:hypothetical protein